MLCSYNENSQRIRAHCAAAIQRRAFSGRLRWFSCTERSCPSLVSGARSRDAVGFPCGEPATSRDFTGERRSRASQVGG